MKKSILIPIVLAAAAAVWFRFSNDREALRRDNSLLLQQIHSMEQGLQAVDARRETDLKAADELASRISLQSRRAPSTNGETGALMDALIPPDPARQGGWAKGAGYFYLPKSQLTNLSYRLIADTRVTDETALLLGLSPAERQQVDEACKEMLENFRQMELARIQPAKLPQGWVGNGGLFETGVAFQVPDLSDQVAALEQTFAQQITGALGTSRGEILQQASQSFLRENMDDLGSGERTIGFLWQAGSDGSKSLWYGVADARHGEGSFQAIPDNLPPDSQIAYYAGLLGIKLPGK